KNLRRRRGGVYIGIPVRAHGLRGIPHIKIQVVLKTLTGGHRRARMEKRDGFLGDGLEYDFDLSRRRFKLGKRLFLGPSPSHGREQHPCAKETPTHVTQHWTHCSTHP